MNYKPSTLFVLLLPSLLIATVISAKETLPNPVVLANNSQLKWTPCWFNIPTTKTVKCAYFFPADGQHIQLKLPVVVIKNSRLFPPTSPVLYLAGGPGYPTGLTAEDMKWWWDWVNTQQWPGDLVLFDQRGTGLGIPILKCPEVTSKIRTLLAQPLRPEELFEQLKPSLKRCHSRFQKQGIDLALYTTPTNSHDAMELMKLLGETKQWNIYGVSYGTRIALDLIRRYPQQIRSVILDSVYPPEKQELLELPFLYDSAFSRLLQGCKANLNCTRTFPQLETALFSMLKQLRNKPVTLTVTDFTTDRKVKVALTEQNLADVIFYALYQTEFISQLPAALVAMQQGKYELIKPMVEEYVYILMDTDSSEGVYWSVECHDSDNQVSLETFLANLAKFPRVKDLVDTAWHNWYCHQWPVESAADSFRQPVSSEIPTLLLAGSYDPITPPLWTKTVAQRFNNGYFFEFPDIGHGVIDGNECASTLVRNFLRHPYHKPEESCLNQLKGIEFQTE